MRRKRSLLHLVALVYAVAAWAICPLGASAQANFDDPVPDHSGKPTFVVSQIKPGSDLKIVAYGDMRFTDPSNTTDTNPRVRKWLAEKIAEVKPDALLVSGDLPYRGSLKADWQVYRQETSSWTAEGLRVYPTLGNHELVPVPADGYTNYFAEFPWLGGRRWYSVQLGSVFVISLDSNGGHSERTFNPGEPQRIWLESQLDHLPPQVNFVFFLTHIPLINDIQSEVIADIPTATELSLRRYLEDKAARCAAKFIVVTGHVHNYERFEHAGISYIISGGGGAKPYPLYARNPEDLYQGKEYPNFNYLVFLVHGKQADATMYRVADPKAATLTTEIKERFTLTAK
jgi:3',5'-cyclic AMP phosphodiesterase CpdA